MKRKREKKKEKKKQPSEKTRKNLKLHLRHPNSAHNEWQFEREKQMNQKKEAKWLIPLSLCPLHFSFLKQRQRRQWWHWWNETKRENSRNAFEMTTMWTWSVFFFLSHFRFAFCVLIFHRFIFSCCKTIFFGFRWWLNNDIFAVKFKANKWTKSISVDGRKMNLFFCSFAVHKRSFSFLVSSMQFNSISFWFFDYEITNQLSQS